MVVSTFGLKKLLRIGVPIDFDEVRQLVGGLSVPVRETSSTLGRPDVKIVDTAKEVRASLIVMGAYGRNRITDYFLGSNAASVARTSPVSVLLAR